MDNVKAWPVGNAASGELALPVVQEVHQERSPTSGAGDATPEQELNWFVLLEMFFQSASSSVGTVGFVWATVVLLGGFVSKLSKIEFWFVTVLSFFQAMRVFGGDWNSDQMTLYGLLLPQRTTINPRAHRLPLYIRIFTNVMIFMETPISPCCTPNWAILFVCGKLFLLLAAITIRFLRLMALLSCVALFATHVTLQSLGRSTTGDDAEDSNMRASLNLFYGLALTQALLSYMVVVFMSSREKLVAELRGCRGLRDLDDELLGLYYSHVRETCRSRGASFALQATFIRFALESITSATHSVRQAGVETLHVLMEASSPCYYREKAALKTRDSPEAMESLFWMATLASPDEGPKRARAACIIAKLAAAGGLRVSGIPSAIPSLCSLLEASSEGVVQSRSDDPVSAQTNLLLKGLEILERLSRSGDNLSEICSPDRLMSILTEFISRDQLLTATATSDATRFQKAGTALLVLTRITGSVGSRGAMLRQVMIRNVSQMSNVRAIILWSTVDGGADHQRLRVLALRTVAGLAFDGETRDSVAARKMVVPLLDVFCARGTSLSLHGAGGDGPNGEELTLTLEAGRALEMLTTGSKPNCAAILEADNDDYLQALCSMLFHHEWLACRPTLARILANLCACSDPGSHGNLQAFITDNISKVLRRTSGTRHDDDTTEELEALLGLGLQFAKWTSPRAFAEALGMIGRERYINKLVMTIAQENQRHGLLRFAIEQAIWMMKHEREVRCVTMFRDDDRMKAALLKVQGAATGIEDYRLLSPNGPVLEHEEPLSSIVRRALKLIGNQAGSA